MKNIIFFSISTLPRVNKDDDPSRNTYFSEEGGTVRYYKGISQLTPGTKHYLSVLADEKKHVDEVIIIASKEARNPIAEYGGKSAVEIYEEEITAYIKHGKTEFDFSVNERGQKDETPYSGDYYNDGSPMLFKVICQEKDDYIWEIVNGLRDHLNNSSISLYLDMQGGNRNDLFSINAILELIRATEISGGHTIDVAGRIATEYTPGNDMSRIVKVDDQYRTYDLLTAYQVFIRYGWGNDLANYFQNTEDEDIAIAIRDVSDAIKFCDVDKFDNGLRKLGTMIGTHKRRNDSQLDYVIDEISKDFGKLLTDEKNMRYVHQIRWCLRKNFIQQAVTILEAKMPTEYVCNGIKSYCIDERKSEEVLLKFREMFEILRTRDNGRDKYKMKDINHYWIKDYGRDCRHNGIGFESMIKPIFKANREKTKENLRTYSDICSNIRNRMNHAASTSSPGIFNSMIMREYQDDSIFAEEGIDPSEAIRKIEEYLDDFEKLAALVPDRIKASVIDFGNN